MHELRNVMKNGAADNEGKGWGEGYDAAVHRIGSSDYTPLWMRLDSAGDAMYSRNTDTNAMAHVSGDKEAQASQSRLSVDCKKNLASTARLLTENKSAKSSMLQLTRDGRQEGACLLSVSEALLRSTVLL